MDSLLPKLPDSAKCCGCSACYAACSVGAISMLPDEEGFLQPVVDGGKCVGCGKCEKVCPVLNPGAPRNPLSVYAAKAKDDELRRISSSGGVFSLLAREVLKKGGVVYGAAFEKNTHRVIHQSAESEEELDALRGSKYVQSDMGDTFIRVKRDLEAGRCVLFSGCPCQVAGLKNYLDSSCSRLLTVEVFCHAAPSPKIWRLFLESQMRESGSRIIRVEPRRNCNWRTFEIAIEFESKDRIRYIRKFPIWYSVFFKELCSRRGCYDCSARCFRSGADISIGDFWGIEQILPSMEDKLGVSVVSVNTQNGESFFYLLGESVHRQNITLSQASWKNKAVLSNEKLSRNRNRFMCEVTAENFNTLSHALTDPPKWFVWLRRMKRRLLGELVE